MDEPRRLTRVEVARILQAGGMRDLDHDSSYGEVLRTLITIRRLVRHAYPHDVALVYAAVVHSFEALNMNLPWSTEDIFFDHIYADIAHVEHNLEGVREEVRSLDTDAGPPSGEEHRGEQGGERGGRSRRVEIMVPRQGERSGSGDSTTDRAGEVPQDPEPVEGTDRSRRGDDLPF